MAHSQLLQNKLQDVNVQLKAEQQHVKIMEGEAKGAQERLEFANQSLNASQEEVEKLEQKVVELTDPDYRDVSKVQLAGIIATWAESRDEFKCGKCGQMMRDPHSLTGFCGHTFCKGCIVDHLIEDTKCPVCQRHAMRADLRPNHPIDQLLNHLQGGCIRAQALRPSEQALGLKPMLP